MVVHISFSFLFFVLFVCVISACARTRSPSHTQSLNRLDEVAQLFPGNNSIGLIGLPYVVFAPIGSGKSTILAKGALTQPHTLYCSLRSSEDEQWPLKLDAEPSSDPDAFVR